MDIKRSADLAPNLWIRVFEVDGSCQLRSLRGLPSSFNTYRVLDLPSPKGRFATEHTSIKESNNTQHGKERCQQVNARTSKGGRCNSFLFLQTLLYVPSTAAERRTPDCPINSREIKNSREGASSLDHRPRFGGRRCTVGGVSPFAWKSSTSENLARTMNLSSTLAQIALIRFSIGFQVYFPPVANNTSLVSY